MLVKIDPLIPVNVRNNNGNIMNINNEANIVLENLKGTGYTYQGPNLFFENEKPRFEAIVMLNKDIKEIYQGFEKE